MASYRTGPGSVQSGLELPVRNQVWCTWAKRALVPMEGSVVNQPGRGAWPLGVSGVVRCGAVVQASIHQCPCVKADPDAGAALSRAQRRGRRAPWLRSVTAACQDGCGRCVDQRCATRSGMASDVVLGDVIANREARPLRNAIASIEPLRIHR
jgi:hypothetical protein